jgi:hypothetical protein
VNLGPTDPAYRAARRVLLDALFGLRPVLDSLVLVGAQAIYLRTRADVLPIAAFTTDGDVTIDPRTLGEEPPLEELMERADFRLDGEPGREEPGIWHKQVEVDDIEVDVPIDLIVPAQLSPSGRRSARLPGHGERSARKASGLEAALVDHESMTVRSLEPSDRRSVEVRVAGTAALLVAKTHKLNDRISRGAARRIDDKDAADVVRLLQSSDPTEVAATLERLRGHPDSGPTTGSAIGYLREIFGRRGAPAIAMAATALEGAMPPEQVRAICIDYVDRLDAALGSADG